MDDRTDEAQRPPFDPDDMTASSSESGGNYSSDGPTAADTTGEPVGSQEGDPEDEQPSDRDEGRSA